MSRVWIGRTWNLSPSSLANVPNDSPSRKRGFLPALWTRELDFIYGSPGLQMWTSSLIRKKLHHLASHVLPPLMGFAGYQLTTSLPRFKGEELASASWWGDGKVLEHMGREILFQPSSENKIFHIPLWNCHEAEIQHCISKNLANDRCSLTCFLLLKSGWIA